MVAEKYLRWRKRSITRSRIILRCVRQWSEPQQQNQELALPGRTICLVRMRYGKAIEPHETIFWGCSCRTRRFPRFPAQCSPLRQGKELGAARWDCCFLGRRLILDGDTPTSMLLARPETPPKQSYS